MLKFDSLLFLRIKILIKNILRPVYYRIELQICLLLELFISPKKTHYSKIPIIINNYNRLDCMVALINALEIRGYSNIFIIDNASTYPPLKEYYRNCKYKIFFLEENVGYLALWRTGIYKNFINDYYAYTDPDVVPIEECPDDFLEYFLSVHKKYKHARKVGFSLKIDDLPDHYNNKAEVIAWEFEFWTKQNEDKLYYARIDTTFALYKPWSWGGSNISRLSFRTDYPYLARHSSWYADSDNPSDEELYLKNMSLMFTHWTKKIKDDIS